MRAGRLKGALIGLVAGGVGGVTTGLIICSDECDSSGGDFSGLITAGLGIGGALAGCGIGAIIGALIRTERWEGVSPPTLRMELETRGGHGIELSLSLPLGRP